MNNKLHLKDLIWKRIQSHKRNDEVMSYFMTHNDVNISAFCEAQYSSPNYFHNRNEKPLNFHDILKIMQ